MFKEITTFMQNKGISLIDSGSAEKGFTKIEILELLDLLSEQKNRTTWIRGVVSRKR